MKGRYFIMEMTLRWYGEGNDSVTLEQIRQIPGVAGVITALHDIPAGEAWTYEDVMKRKPVKASSGIFTKGMTWRIIYQGIMIGLLSLAAFVIGISTPNPPVIEGLTQEQVRVEIGQTMTFIVLAFSELIHVFNIRNNKESIFKIGIGGNKQLFWAIGASAMLMLVILAIPVLRAIFSIPVLPMDRIVETIALVIAPVVIVEIFKLLKINTSKDE